MGHPGSNNLNNTLRIKERIETYSNVEIQYDRAGNGKYLS